MRLSSPFVRLPLRFDVERLQSEAAQFAESEWQRHPTGFAGNSAVRLISVRGGENDDVAGPMAPTPQLARCPYIRQILAQFGVVWSRSRLMRLAPGAGVPEHSDVNYHWFHRVRVHIPVFTQPAVSFTCDGQTVQMGAGEAWIFDNLRAHSVHNGGDRDRIHLVADTAGNSAFWNMVAAGQSGGFDAAPESLPTPVPYLAQPGRALFCERHNLAPVMPPSEVEQLTIDLLQDLRPPQSEEEARASTRLASLASSFFREWRALWTLFGDAPDDRPQFGRLRDAVLAELEKFPQPPVCASNGMSAIEVFIARVLLHAVQLPEASLPPELDRTMSAGSAPSARQGTPARIERPLFIIAAPRSGSTLLFETLAQAPGLHNVGGEAHGLVEDLPQLRPGSAGVGSNRLTEEHLDEQVRAHILGQLGVRLRDRQGRLAGGGAVRFLEKTPKNALRIPFFKALFPDAQFVFLWRDPRENIHSIIEAWRSGGWQTYEGLPGWDGPWSMLLPPGYESLRGKPLEEVAAYQWMRTNEVALDDLAGLPPERWMSLNYAEFLADPAALARRVCDFAGLQIDPQYAEYLSRPLPLSAHTLTPPATDKWRSDQQLIERIVPLVEPLAARLAGLRSA